MGYWVGFDFIVIDLLIIFWYYVNYFYIVNKCIGGKLSWYNFDCILCYSNYDKIFNLILLLEIEFVCNSNINICLNNYVVVFIGNNFIEKLIYFL